MKICVVTTAFPRWAGDAQAIFVWESVRALARQGLQMRVLAMHSPGAPTHEYMENIEIVRPRYWWPERYEFLRKEGAAGLPATWRKYPLARLQIVPFFFVHTLAALYGASGCDLVHAHWTLSAASACFGRWVHHCPVVATVQGSDILQVTKHPLGAQLTRNILLCCDRITALSRALARAVVNIGVPPNRIQVIPNGVDTARFTPPLRPDRDKLILYVGSFIERKGLHYLLAAMPGVLRSFPDYRLVLIGDGPQRALLRQLADELGIAQQVMFLDFQPQAQVRDWMQRARLFVLPSTEEGMGVVLVEAMACGTPVIASKVDGIVDVVTPEVGILAPPTDSQSLAEAIKDILGDPRRWEEMSRTARERAVEHYDWDHIAAQFVSLYQSARGLP